MAERDYRIGVVSRDHVQRGAEDGSLQLNHGNRTPPQRPHAGDSVVTHNPAFDDSERTAARTLAQAVAAAFAAAAELEGVRERSRAADLDGMRERTRADETVT